MITEIDTLNPSLDPYFPADDHNDKVKKIPPVSGIL
jgi:hypothetical protein